MKKKKKRDKHKIKRKQLNVDQLEGILNRVRPSLSEDEYETLKGAVDTLAFVTQQLESKNASIRRLRRLIFGASTEKTSKIFADKDNEQGSGTDAEQEQQSEQDATVSKDDKNKEKTKRKGHGRNAASDYTGAEKVTIAHESLSAGELCPKCERGKLSVLNQPAVIVRVKGMSPLIATVYERERLRCNLCGALFTAKPPEGIGEEKYDETASSMIALLKYGCGLPFNRLERLQKSLGIPLPSSTQWDIVQNFADKVVDVYEQLIDQAAQGKVLHNDDTMARILELYARSKDETKDKKSEQRTGVFTTGIVSIHDNHKVALFFTGPKHAGQNLENVLQRRKQQLGAPIQMCDLLSSNTAGDFETIVAGCILHSRRRYVDVVESFPEQVKHVLDVLKKVYEYDDICKKDEMTDAERLALHQQKSGPLMQELKQWLTEQIEQKKVEPNSGIGEAIQFMQKHWDRLTLFLRVPGAPLDNNLCERAIKKAILNRKNAFFYKTENGARVGDMFMGFIHTSELNGADPFDYLVAIQRYCDEASKNPNEWMPWNYKQTLAKLIEDTLQ